VTVERKISSRFTLDYDYVNVNKMDLEFVLSEPELELNEVIIRAAEDTINSIAFVKAFIDVEGTTEAFTKEVPIVAYDQQGRRVDLDIMPSAVRATVYDASPSKTVQIIVDTVGEITDDQAIDNIVMEHEPVTLLGPDNVLAQIVELSLPINGPAL